MPTYLYISDNGDKIEKDFDLGKQPDTIEDPELGTLKICAGEVYIVKKAGLPGQFVTRNRQDSRLMERIKKARVSHGYAEEQTKDQDAADKHMFRKRNDTGLKPPKQL